MNNNILKFIVNVFTLHSFIAKLKAITSLNFSPGQLQNFVIFLLESTSFNLMQ